MDKTDWLVSLLHRVVQQINHRVEQMFHFAFQNSLQGLLTSLGVFVVFIGALIGAFCLGLWAGISLYHWPHGKENDARLRLEVLSSRLAKTSLIASIAIGVFGFGSLLLGPIVPGAIAILVAAFLYGVGFMAIP